MQGWKLHISTIPPEAGALLTLVVPVLKRRNVAFKVAHDQQALMSLNEGSLGAFQIGKFITIYPADDEQAVALARELAAVTAGFHGPKIITDIRLGDVVYARFGGFHPVVRRDRFGHLSRWVWVGGDLVPDDYSVPLSLPAAIANPFAQHPAFAATQAAADAPAPATLGPGYKIVDIVKSQPKGSVFLGIDTRDPRPHGLVIIKEGRAWCDTDRLGRDIRARLSHQHRLLRLLEGVAYVPAAHGLFEWDDNRYLVLEFVRGHELSAVSAGPFGTLSLRARTRLLRLCVRLVEAVADLHARGIVHRDLTVRNIWVREDGSPCLIDLELAHLVGSAETPFEQGTPGFMSPQQQDGRPPTPEDDVHALGACLLQVFTRLDPRRIAHVAATDRVASVQYLAQLTDARLASLLCACLAVAPGGRPSLAELAAALKDLKRRCPVHTVPAAEAGDRLDRSFVASACAGMLLGTAKDETGTLFVSARPRGHADAETFDFMRLRSANNGMAGVLYVMAQFHRLGYVVEGGAATANALVDWLLAHHPTEDDQLPGLHFGEAGVAVAIAQAIAGGLVERGAWCDDYFGEALNGPLDWPDLTHGAAGQGIAAFICGELLQREALAAGAHRCAGYLLATQDAGGCWTLGDGVAALRGVSYTGFAHGTAGILYFLIEYYRRYADARVWTAITRGVRWLTRQRSASARCTTWPTQAGGGDRWHWWCHGEAGIALTFLALYAVTREDEWKAIAASALSFHRSPLRVANLSQCHGLSGLGEIYLEAYRTLGDERWKQKAAEIVAILRALAGRDAVRGTTWLVENPYRPMADLMVGAGGVAHFLLRYLHAEQHPLSYPLLPPPRAAGPCSTLPV